MQGKMVELYEVKDYTRGGKTYVQTGWKRSAYAKNEPS